MADYNPRFNRGGYGRFKKDKYFIAAEAGTDAFFLEDEANELQWIQNELRAGLIRRKYYSGIYSKPADDIVESAEVFENNNQIFNSFLVKPMVANINGYLFDVLGANGYKQNGNIEQYKDLNYIVLPEPPERDEYYDFVYLEMAFVEIKFTSQLWHFGNRNNSYGLINNDLFDKRINAETNRRIQLQWNIYVARVPMNSENAQMRHDAMFDEQTFAMLVPAHGGYHGNSGAGFIYAENHPYYKSSDKGLWIAGSGLENIEHQLYSTDGFSYAIPLFKVIRRNSNGYAANNLYGSNNIDPSINSFSTRPDGKFANIIYKDDIIDLRNFINPGSLQSILQTNFEKLLLNELPGETKLYSTSFGLDEIVPDDDTIIYEPCNIDSFNEDVLEGLKTYTFQPGLEREGIILDDNTYFKFSKYVKNLSLSGMTLQMVINVPTNVTYAGLFTIKDQNREDTNIDKIWATGFINNKQIFLQVNDRSIIYNFEPYYGKFTHIAFAMQDKRVQLIINNKIIDSVDTTDEINFSDYTELYIGHDIKNNTYANGILFDEIELSKVFENQFSRIPGNITSNNSEFAIDTQFGRANYTKSGDEDSYTFHITSKSDENGVLDINLNLPYTVQFTDTYPTIYFDNESIPVEQEVSVTWYFINSSKWNVRIQGVGNEVTYNLVIIAPVRYPNKQGINPVFKKAHLLRAEKCDIDFMAVNDLKEYEIHNIPKLPIDTKFANTAELITYNPYLTTHGFLNALKLKYTVYNQNQIILPKTNYTDLISIFAVKLNNINILNDFYEDDDNLIINLTDFYNDVVDIYAVTKYNAVVYSPKKGGLENLFKTEEVNDYGNGSKRTFIYRSESKIMSLLSTQIKYSQYHIAYVNGVPKRVSITIDGAFIHYTFDAPPENKANIKTFIVSEYDPLRSERLEFFYEVAKEKEIDLATLNGTDIIYHDNEIFVTTDGYGLYPRRDSTVNIKGQEVSFAERAMDQSQTTPIEPEKPDDDVHTVSGDTVVEEEEEFVDKDGRSVYTERRAYASSDGIERANFKVIDNENREYTYLRFVTEQGVISPLSYNNDEITVHSANLKYSCEVNEGNAIPLFRFITNDDAVHSLEDPENVDIYKAYMLNKQTVNIDTLPAINRLDLIISPADLLKSSKCDVIFGTDNAAHVVTRDKLPISTNLSATINYVVPLNGYSLLKTFNKLIVMNTTSKVFNGITQASIDGKSFYSLTQLDEECKHVNVFPFLIKNHILRLGILTTYCEDRTIYIDVSLSAFGTFATDYRYLIQDE